MRSDVPLDHYHDSRLAAYFDQGQPRGAQSVPEGGKPSHTVFYRLRNTNFNKPGPAQVGAISKTQKIAKGLQSVKVFSSTPPEKFFWKKVSQC